MLVQVPGELNQPDSSQVNEVCFQFACFSLDMIEYFNVWNQAVGHSNGKNNGVFFPEKNCLRFCLITDTARGGPGFEANR